MIDPTDIVALVLMALFVVRRMEVRATDGRAFPGVPRGPFEGWKAQAIRSRSVAVNACFLKVFTNTLWYFGLRNHLGMRAVQVGGLVIFLGWLAGIVWSAFLSYRARGVADRLGIVIGRRLAGPADEAPPPPQ